VAIGDAAVTKTGEQTLILTDSANIWFSFFGIHLCGLQHRCCWNSGTNIFTNFYWVW